VWRVDIILEQYRDSAPTSSQAHEATSTSAVTSAPTPANLQKGALRTHGVRRPSAPMIASSTPSSHPSPSAPAASTSGSTPQHTPRPQARAGPSHDGSFSEVDPSSSSTRLLEPVPSTNSPAASSSSPPALPPRRSSRSSTSRRRDFPPSAVDPNRTAIPNESTLSRSHALSNQMQGDVLAPARTEIEDDETKLDSSGAHPLSVELDASRDQGVSVTAGPGFDFPHVSDF